VQADTITSHKQSDQFWCPKAFDLSVYNTFDNMENKVVNVFLTTCSRLEFPFCAADQARGAWFDGKMVMMLTNSQHINYDQKYIRDTDKESHLYWFPLQFTLPETNRVTMQR